MSIYTTNRLKEFKFYFWWEPFFTNIYYFLQDSRLLGFSFLLETRRLTKKEIVWLKQVIELKWPYCKLFERIILKFFVRIIFDKPLLTSWQTSDYQISIFRGLKKKLVCVIYLTHVKSSCLKMEYCWQGVAIDEVKLYF